MPTAPGGLMSKRGQEDGAEGQLCLALGQGPSPCLRGDAPQLAGTPSPVGIYTGHPVLSVPASRFAGIQRGSVAPAVWARPPAPGADLSLPLCP